MAESKFEEQCREYFKKYYERLAQQGLLIIPWKVTDCSRNLGEFIPSMRSWFGKTINERKSIQGLVLQSFSIWKHLCWYGFKKEMVKRYLQIDNISEELSTIVYNPQESAVLLLHKAESENLATDIALAFNYLKLFILLFHNVLKNSGMKLIPLVVSNENINADDGDCHLCINHVLSKEDIADFPNWLEKKENYFQAEEKERTMEELSKSFLAKVTGVLAAAPIHSSYMPRFIGDQYDSKQMKHVKVLLTPAQMDIFYSPDKHMIIKGGFGCGKSIIAAAMLEKIAESLQNDEKLFHICYDARSKLLNKMVNNTQENSKVTPFHNKDGLMLSAIIDQITKPDRSEKINLVIDEYNGEDLDTSEANKLNRFFSESLKESYVALIVQPIKKERIINNVSQEKNRFDILEEHTMKEHFLKSNMRNSKEIHKLVEATKELLKDKQTVFIHAKDNKVGDESEKREESKTSNKSEEWQESSEENSISKEEISKHEENQELEAETKCETNGQSVENKKSSVEREIKEQSVENYINTKMDLDGAEAIKRSPVVNRNKNEDGSIHEAKHESKEKSVKNYSGFRMELDEAQAIIGSPMGNYNGGNSLRSNFEHAEVDSIGHDIETEKPQLFELGDQEEFKKSLSLVAIFTKLLSFSNKHVVLHFDTEPNSIPSALRFAFDHHFRDKKETTNFKEFESNKRVLVCSYPTFRGLEYPRITVLIDRNIYFQQHYLVEMLTRCTSKLFVVVLQNSPALANVIEKWKTDELVNQWKTKISEKRNQTKDSEFSWDDEQKIINGIFKSKYYEELARTFKSLSIDNESTSSARVYTAQEIINQHR